MQQIAQNKYPTEVAIKTNQTYFFMLTKSNSQKKNKKYPKLIFIFLLFLMMCVEMAVAKILHIHLSYKISFSECIKVH